MIKDFILGEDWFTHQTYVSSEYKDLPNASGVYCFVLITFINKKYVYDILYIGSAKNLLKRYKTHKTLKRLSKFYNDIFFFFKEADNYLEVEKDLIKKHQPRHNITWL